ncbi:MAG: hypothetical protein ACR2NW_06710 [Thermodesulfobacteriota bacterium]
MNRLILPILLVAVTILSCTNVQTTSHFSSPQKSLDNYIAVEINQFESATLDFPEDGLVEIPNLVAEKLRNTNTHFKEVKYGEIDNYPPEKTVVVLGEIAKYIGSGDVRYESGNVKFGEIEINVDIAILQKSNGREITTGEVNSFNSASFFGGKDKMYDEIANEIVKYILKIN